jgi:hypothetical protein
MIVFLLLTFEVSLIQFEKLKLWHGCLCWHEASASWSQEKVSPFLGYKPYRVYPCVRVPESVPKSPIEDTQ